MGSVQKIRNYIFLLLLGHFSVDLNQGALPAALPFLMAARNMNYTSAAGLMFATNVTSSIVQPLFGHLGDKAAKYWYISLGLVLAGSGFAIMGFLEDYWAMFVAVMVSGLGNSIFHPEGGRLANQVSEENKNTNMSIFAIGGNLAFAVGPIIISLAITNFGMKGTAVFFIPAYIVAVIYLVMIKDMPGVSREGKGAREGKIAREGKALAGPWVDAPVETTSGAAGRPGIDAVAPGDKDDWRAFAKLSVLIFFRAAVLYGMTTFIPLYWVGVLMQSRAAGSVALAIYSFASTVGTPIGGLLADRIGYSKIIKISSVSFVPLIALFTFVPDLRLSTFLLVAMGLAGFLCFSTVITTGQYFIPNHIGFASGITMGMGVSVGGITAPILGRISDLYGLTTTFYVLIALSCLMAVSGFLIPAKKR